jgi:diguanylate cyclase (GGDEF)-like protein
MTTTRYVRDIETATTIGERMLNRFSSAYTYADLLELMVEYNDGEITEDAFNSLAKMAILDNECISSFQLAPKGVVSYIYPMEGNEAAMGHRLLDDPERRRYVEEAIDTGKLVTQGPLMSKQDKMLVFARKAIMIDDKFWGLSVIAIDFDELVEECGLTDDTTEYVYAVGAYKDGSDVPEYTWGDTSVLENPDAYNDIKPDNCEWRIAVKHKPSLASVILNYGLYILASLLIGIAVYAICKAYIYTLKQSNTDAVTNTINGKEFKKQAVSRLKNKRSGVCALLSVDLDGFNEINSIYGHRAGDKVLACTAERMHSALRGNDLVSRADKDEFLIFLSDIQSEEQVLKVVKRLKELTGQEIPIGDGETTVKVYISVGYAMTSADGREYTILYKTADDRMYADKSDRNFRG